MADYCTVAPGDSLHGPYHDREYGFPAREEAVLFERLVLEINQAGLSWDLMLRKRAGFRAAFEGYDVDRVAAYGASERARLLADAAIVRNRRKIDAVIENAKRIKELRTSHAGFAAWLKAHHPREPADWVKLFRRTFVFMGPEVVGEFLLSLGYLPGAHRADCPAYARIVALAPPWLDHAGPAKNRQA